MNENVFDFWENMQVTFNYLAVVSSGLKYTGEIGWWLITDINFFPDVFNPLKQQPYYLKTNVDIGMEALLDEERQLIALGAPVGEETFHIFPYDGSQFPTKPSIYFDSNIINITKDLVLPYEGYKHTSLPKPIEEPHVYAAMHPFFIQNYKANLSYPFWTWLSFEPLAPAQVYMFNDFGFVSQDAIFKKYTILHHIFFVLTDDETITNWCTDNDYIFKDYLTTKNSSKEVIFTYDYMQTKVPHLKMRNKFFPKRLFEIDNDAKWSLLHHDFKNQKIITNNFYIHKLKYEYNNIDINGKENLLIWKDSNFNLTGLQIMYYDYFGSPEARWMDQWFGKFIYYFNEIIFTNHSGFHLQTSIDNNLDFFNRYDPPVLYAEWVQWDKIEFDNLIYRNMIEVENWRKAQRSAFRF